MQFGENDDANRQSLQISIQSICSGMNQNQFESIPSFLIHVVITVFQKHEGKSTEAN